MSNSNDHVEGHQDAIEPAVPSSERDREEIDACVQFPADDSPFQRLPVAGLLIYLGIETALAWKIS